MNLQLRREELKTSIFGTPEAGSNAARLELLLVVFANVAITGLNIVVGLVVARHFSVEDYGRLSYFINTFGLLRFLASLGMTSQVTFALARARGQTEPIGPQFYPLLVIRMATIIGITGIILVIGFFRADDILIVSMLASVFALLHDFGIGALQGLKRTRKVVALLIVQPVLYTLGAFAAVSQQLSVTMTYWAFTLSFVPTALLAGIWIVRSAGWPSNLFAQLRVTYRSLNFAGQMYLLAIAGTLFTSYTTLYYGWVGKYIEAALITIPLNLVFMSASIVGAAMTTVYFPRMSEMYAHNDKEQAQSLFHLFYKFVSAGTVLISLSLMFYPSVILGILYGAHYQNSALLLTLIAPVAFLYPIQTVLTMTIVAQGRGRLAIHGALVAMAALVVGVTIISLLPNALMWVAFAHSLTALLGMIWQLRIVRYGMRTPLLQTGQQLVIILPLFVMGRLLMPDNLGNKLRGTVVLSVITIVYLAWVWCGTGAVKSRLSMIWSKD